MLGVVRTNGTY